MYNLYNTDAEQNRSVNKLIDPATDISIRQKNPHKKHAREAQHGNKGLTDTGSEKWKKWKMVSLRLHVEPEENTKQLVTQNKRLQVVKHVPTATENAKQMACHCQPS